MRVLRRLNNISISAARNFYYRRVQEGCECPEPENKHPIVEEKDCGCTFSKWKPKPRKVLECEIKRPTPPRRCYAGMHRTNTPDCNSADIDPFKGKSCLQAKPQKPPPPKQKEKPLPVADWDVDCKT